MATSRNSGASLTPDDKPTPISSRGQFLVPSHPLSSGTVSKVITGSCATPDGHRGWHSRGFLPHWDQPETIQSVSFRLADSLPEGLIDSWRAELGIKTRMVYDKNRSNSSEPKPDSERRSRELALRRLVSEYEDAGHGSCWLRDPRIGRVVEDALLHFDAQRYRLLAWCVMPNHVHVLIEPWEGWPLASVVHTWKSFTANHANRLLEMHGRFWQREYHDRYIRDAEHYASAVKYIEENPVKAGLVRTPIEWSWSSAKYR